LLNELHAWRGSNARDFADDVTMVAVAVGTDSHVERRK